MLGGTPLASVCSDVWWPSEVWSPGALLYTLWLLSPSPRLCGSAAAWLRIFAPKLLLYRYAATPPRPARYARYAAAARWRVTAGTSDINNLDIPSPHLHHCHSFSTVIYFISHIICFLLHLILPLSMIQSWTCRKWVSILLLLENDIAHTGPLTAKLDYSNNNNNRLFLKFVKNKFVNAT